MEPNYAILTDESPMPYGTHAGKKMKDVPASYLVWLADNDKMSRSVRHWWTIKKNEGNVMECVNAGLAAGPNEKKQHFVYKRKAVHSNGQRIPLRDMPVRSRWR